MKLAICDDDEQSRELLLTMVEDYAAQYPQRELTALSFSRGEDLLEAVGKANGIDLCILDIIMPEMNGIQLGLRLRQAGYDGKILYLTTSPEYALDSFQVRPFNYLLKPLEADAFFAALDETFASLSSKREKSLIVKTREGSIKLTFDSILYAELIRRSIRYHLTNGETVESIQLRTSFSEAMQELLRDRRFSHCGASIVANLHHITMVESEALLFQNTHKLYLSRKACREIRSAWYDYWLDEEG